MPEKKSFIPLLFAPARRGKVHTFRYTALRYSSAAHLPLLFPKNLRFSGTPNISPWRGLKRSTERTVIPILHRRRSGSATVFSLPFSPGCFFSKKDFQKSRSKFLPVLKKQLIMNPTPFLLENRKKRKRALRKEALRNLLHLLHFIFYRPFCQATVLLKNKSAQKQTQEKRLYKK